MDLNVFMQDMHLVFIFEPRFFVSGFLKKRTSDTNQESDPEPRPKDFDLLFHFGEKLVGINCY